MSVSPHDDDPTDLADDAPDGDEGVAAEEEPRQRRLHLSHTRHAHKEARSLSHDQYHEIIDPVDHISSHSDLQDHISPFLIRHSESKTEDRISL